MEKKIGRLLKDNEIVHHINKDGKDNRVINLKLMTRSEHQSIHRMEKKNEWHKIVEYQCDTCGRRFKRKFRARDLTSKHFCSQPCVAKYAGRF
jgi:hypothetical protein